MPQVTQNFPAKPYVVTRAAANFPQTTQTAWFTVATGKVAVKIYGELATEHGAVANTFQWISNPTTGADVNLCAASADQTSAAAGTMYSLTGVMADALYVTTSGAFEDQSNWYIVAPGTIDLKTTGSTTGTMKVSIQWMPIDSGATVVTA